VSTTTEPKRPKTGIKPYRLTVNRIVDGGGGSERHDAELLVEILVDQITKDEPHHFALSRLGVNLRCRSCFGNTPARFLEVSSDPAGQGGLPHYGETKVFLPGEDVPIVLDGREIDRIVV